MGRLDHLDSKRNYFARTGAPPSACRTDKPSEAEQKSATLEKDVSLKHDLHRLRGCVVG